MGNYEAIFTPIQIGTCTLKNRILLAPMEGTSMIDWLMKCEFRKHVHDFYIERAKNGVGLFIPGMVPVRSMFGEKWLYDYPEVFEPVKELVDEIHQYGAKVFFQIGIFSGRNFTLSSQMSQMLSMPEEGPYGGFAHSIRENMVSPDDGLPNVWMPEFATRALTTQEVEQFVDAYAKVALLCKNAGIDGVEIHAVHEGYLMDQFTLPYTNHRTDKYGGTFENRYRFATEVVGKIKELCGREYPVAMRYSVTSKTRGFNQGAVPGEVFTEVGRTMEESEKAIKLLENAGVDMFDCDNGTYDAWFWAHPPVYMPENCNLEDAKHIKHYTSKPVFVAGKMQMEAAEKEISEGTIDGVAIGRQLLTDGEFLTKLESGKEDEVRPCISCHNGCFPLHTYKGVGAETTNMSQEDMRFCALNSRCFAEKKYVYEPVEHPKKIAVIGGGISGMEFAIQASGKGHKVTLYEQSNRLGGVFVAAASMSFKEKDRDLLKWYENELKKHPVEVRMNSRITELSSLDADEIVVATGAVPRTVSIEKDMETISAVDYLMNPDGIGDKIAIIGGGLTGCEIAYELALQGKHPFIIEQMDDLVKAPGVCAANSNMLRELIRFHEIPVYLQSSVKKIHANKILIESKAGVSEAEIDNVIVSIGYSPNVPFEYGKLENVHILGDANKVGNLKDAIWKADDLALEI